MFTRKYLNPAWVIAAVWVIWTFLAALSRGAEENPTETPLPDLVERAIREVYPQAQIEEWGYERRLVELIEVTVVQDGGEHDLILSLDGSIVAIKQPIDPQSLPDAVRHAVHQIAEDTTIHEAERVDVVAELRPVPIDTPRVQYEIEWRLGGREQQATVSNDGVIMNKMRRLKVKSGR